jgi:bifunctional DNase/RNase
MKRIVIGIGILVTGLMAGILVTGFSPVGMMIYQQKDRLGYEDLMLVPQLSLDDFAEAAIGVDGNEIHLLNGCRRLTMVTTEHQADSIVKGIEGVLDIRPNSHDLMKNVLETFGMEPIMVKVTHLDHGAYYSRLFLVQGTRILNIDSRPTDSIAIAVRTGTPIFVNQELLETEGENIC